MIISERPLPFVGELFGARFDGADTQITVAYADMRDVRYDDEARRLTDEKFILTVEPSEACLRACILCSGEKSALYALCELDRRLQAGAPEAGTTVCAPRFAVRGYIEGFYGTPWTQAQRLRVMALMAKNRMNTVFYAPKDDAYHRALWREKYPADKLENLRILADAARRYTMDFVWCVAPGLSIEYGSGTDFAALMEKTRQLYGIGVRAFGLLLDDISETLAFEADTARYGETVNAHIDLAARYYEALQALDTNVRLTVCPMQYHGRGDEYYISKLGQGIDPRISVFFTGRDICSRDLTSVEALHFYAHTRHKPLYWDNYPVNDMAMRREMHLSPVINRASDLWKYAEGIIFNCMEYAECSCIPLITGADYLWNSENYEPETSFVFAVKQVVGEKNADSFLLFADHLYISCLQDENSRRMKRVFEKMQRLFSAGDPAAALGVGEAYLAELNACMAFLQSDAPLCAELAQWTEKYGLYCGIIKTLLMFARDAKPELRDSLRTLFAQYEAMPARFADPMDLEEAFAFLTGD